MTNIILFTGLLYLVQIILPTPLTKRSGEAAGERARKAVHNLRESKDEGADFWINYTVSKQRQQIIHSTGYDKGMHGGVSAGSYGNSVMVGYSSGPSVREYDEGTAILDVIDASTQKIVWRGIAEGRLKDHPTMSERYKATTAVASELLGDFPPGTAP